MQSSLAEVTRVPPRYCIALLTFFLLPWVAGRHEPKCLSPVTATDYSGGRKSVCVFLSLDLSAVEQIRYASRYARSRKQRSFCTTAKYKGFGCAGVGENKQQK